MSIKQAHAVVADVQMAARLDSLLADLDSGQRVPRDRIVKVLADVRGGIDVPRHYLTDDERAELIISSIQGSDNPLEQARTSCTQNFFADPLVPHGVRYRVAQYLVDAFGVKGNPMWSAYLNGTFRFIDTQTLEGED